MGLLLFVAILQRLALCATSHNGAFKVTNVSNAAAQPQKRQSVEQSAAVCNRGISSQCYGRRLARLPVLIDSDKQRVSELLVEVPDASK
jgi:hypothetical protein